jgi:hypothetical protein
MDKLRLITNICPDKSYKKLIQIGLPKLMNAYEVVHLMKVARNFEEAEGRAGISEFKS